MIGEVGLAREAFLWLIDAMFCMGVLHTSMNVSGTVKIGSVEHDVSSPYVEHIPFCDFFWDTSVTRKEQCAFMGHRQWLSMETIRALSEGDNPVFDPEVVAELKADEHSRYTEHGQIRPEMLAFGDSSSSDRQLYPGVYLRHAYLPFENRLVTYPIHQAVSRPLRNVDFYGDESGPYDVLTFMDVPGSLMQTSPVSHLTAMNELANAVFVKLGSDALNYKRILPVPTKSRDDAARLTRAPNGTAVHIDNASAIKEVAIGGPDPQIMAFMIWIKDLFSYRAGNIDAQGGLGQQAETLGQEEIISVASSKLMQRMSSRFVEGIRSVLKKVAFYLWYDPLISLPLTYRVQGTSVDVPIAWDASWREADFLQFNFEVTPYSIPQKTPEQQLRGLMTLLQQTIVPLLALFEQQGKTLDMEVLLREIERLSGLHSLSDLIIDADPQLQRPGPVQDARKPSVTTRREVRENRPGRTMQGTSLTLMQNLLGGRTQASETAAATRMP